MIIAVLAALAVLGSYLLTSSYVSAVAAAVFAILMCAAALPFVKRRKEITLSLLVFVALVLVLISYQKVAIRMSFSRAERLAAACERYKAKTGRYPKELSEVLADAHLSSLRAKYTLFWCGFHYVNDQIYFVPDPTMPVPAYDLTAKKWTAISLFRDVRKQGS